MTRTVSRSKSVESSERTGSAERASFQNIREPAEDVLSDDTTTRGRTRTRSTSISVPRYAAPPPPPPPPLFPAPPLFPPVPVPITVARERKTPMDMPHLSNKGAPRLFTGKYEDVEEFLMRYEQCCHDCNLTDGHLKTYTIRRYCNSKVRGVLEGLAESYASSWPKFKKAFEEYFDAARARRKYRETDLVLFTEDSRTERMQNLTQFKKYMREFATIGGWLHQKGKITSEQRCKYFWAGLHKRFRDAAERRILSVEPDWDIATPFRVEMVTGAAKYLLDPERFDADVLEDEGDVRGRWMEDEQRITREKG
jgi:hypothetical protein